MAQKRNPHPHTCVPCPHRYAEHGCPFWIRAELGVIEELPSGEKRIYQGCTWHDGLMVRWLSHVIAAANRGAAVAETARNDLGEMIAGVAMGVQKVGSQLVAGKIISDLLSVADQPPAVPQLEHEEEDADVAAPDRDAAGDIQGG